jgi:hypothetical protein
MCYQANHPHIDHEEEISTAEEYMRKVLSIARRAACMPPDPDDAWLQIC